MIGTLEVITGGMYCGKSSELQRRIKRAEIAKQNTIIFKPAIDNRYSAGEICTHDGVKMDSMVVGDVKSILKNTNGFQVIGIEEVQFFKEDIIDIIEYLRNIGKRVIVAGLDMDYLGFAFNITATLMAVADKVDKLTAVCVKCGKAATMSYRVSKDQDRIVVGSKEYEARCRECWSEI